MNLLLCHATEDADFAGRLLADLGELGVRRGGLDDAATVLALASRAALGSAAFREPLLHARGRGLSVIVTLLDECELPASLAASPIVDFRDADRYGAAFYRLCARLGLRPFGSDEASQVARPKKWHCIFCGWRCSDPSNNSYLCHRCQRLRPLMADSCTCIQCLLCNELSLAAGSYCEWCGERLGAIEA